LVGRDLTDHLVPTSLPWAGTQDRAYCLANIVTLFSCAFPSPIFSSVTKTGGWRMFYISAIVAH